jgi:DNA-binding NarL/FixJ family response regulator
MIKILLVDDEPAVRMGLRMRLELEADLAVVGEANDGLQALALARTVAPDVVVMDIEMPGMDGITATARMGELSRPVSVVILSIHGDAGTRARAQAAGAKSFVEKQGPVEELLGAIRRAALAPQAGSDFSPRPGSAQDRTQVQPFSP